MSTKKPKELHEVSPFARMKMLVSALWGQIELMRGEANRGWDLEFLRSQVDWATLLVNREVVDCLPVQPELYRGEWIIQPDYSGFMWVHKDYDGPEDRRIGNSPTIEDCKRDIDEWLIEDMSKALDRIDYHLRRAVNRDWTSWRSAERIAEAYYRGTDSEFENRNRRQSKAANE